MHDLRGLRKQPEPASASGRIIVERDQDASSGVITPLRSAASRAATFRSKCGSERGAPEYPIQRILAATPHVGQAMAENRFVIRALFTRTDCNSARDSAVPL
jgi:hypothetical protein